MTCGRPLRIVILVAAALASTMLVAPAAGAAEYAAPESYAGACGTSHNGGGRDASGRLYMACGGSSVLVVDRDGTRRKAPISHHVDRVAPSPDGRYLYSISANATTGARRFARQADGSYARDAFRFDLPPLYAQHGWPLCGGGIATDGYGDVYLSTGGWCDTGNMILKFAPDGTYLTGFGDYGASAHWTFRIDGTGAECTPGTSRCRQVLARNDVGSNPGKFQVNMSIAVTADGARVWVADNNNMRVQWFDRIGGAAYVFAGMWSGEGAMHADSVGSTYGIAVDPWGFAYVATTTRCQVWRLDPNGTSPLLVAAPTCSARDHVLAVDAQGTVWVGEWGARIRRTSALPGAFPALPPKPPIDRTDPILADVTVPSETTDTGVTIQIDARDDVAVTEMRFADESGNPGPWIPFAAAPRVELSPGLGYKVLSVQVRDARRGESAMVSRRLVRRAVPDTTAPALAASVVGTPTSRAARLSITATDVIGVTHLRVAGDDGTFGEWISWGDGTRELAHDLGGDAGTHAVAIQVRDAAYNVSDTATLRVTIVVPAPSAPAPPAAVVGGGGAAVPAASPAASPATPAVRDTLAPKLRMVRVPARTCSRVIRIRVTSTDDRGAVRVRIANENGRYGRWQRYRGSIRHVLTRRATRKLVTIQVADAAGNVSRSVSRRTLVVRCGR